MSTDEGPFTNAIALIVDGSAAARHGMQLALNHLGVSKVVIASRATDAKRQLAQRTFDIILCDYNFDHGLNGGEFFQELRQSRALPLATIFIMVTNEASLAKVADVAEIAPDDYLIKPVTAMLLETRLLRAKQKKELLSGLYAVYEKDDFEGVIRIGATLLADSRFPHATDVSQFMAQAHLALGRVDEAMKFYDRVLESKAAPWARLGIHRGKEESRAAAEAGPALRNLVSESATYFDAYDKLARLRAKEGRFEEALGIYERALKVSPDHVGRLQVAGQLAFCVGNSDQGIAFLGRALAGGARGTSLDARSILHLVLMRFDKSEAADVAKLATSLRAALENDPDNFRTQVLSRLGTICANLSTRQIGQAVAEIRQIAVLGVDERFTFELACDTLAILDRMYARDIHNDLDLWTAQLTRRFAVSTQSSSLMTGIMRQSPALAAIIRENEISIQTLANEGMQLLVDGNYKDAAVRLLEYGEDTFNARLLAIACNAGARYATQSDDEKIIKAAARAYDLIQRFGEGGLHLPQELAERVKQFGAGLKQQFSAPVTEIAQSA